MGHTLTIQVAEDLYAPLEKQARQNGQTPEELVVQWLTDVMREQTRRVSAQNNQDPLEKFIGAFHSNIPNWAEDHDHHIAHNIMNQIRGKDNAEK
ncbi:MAG: hypothetical protein HZC40_18280 [Chloroflexi bacterium]|nr:hypothetical protein [Chloroflexota bacterium]